MQAGKFRHLISLEQQVLGAVNEFGERLQTWVTIQSVWADVSPISPTRMTGVKEALLGGADTDSDIYTVTLYPVAGLTAGTWRFQYNGRTYDVLAARRTNDDATMMIFAGLGKLDGITDDTLHIVLDGGQL